MSATADEQDDRGPIERLRDEQPDPAVLWRWVARSVRPYLGWVLIGLGVVALVVGYLGVSRELLVARQIPYFASGGLAGISLVFLGGIALLIDDLRDANERLEVAEHTADQRLRAIESAVADLRDVLLAHPDAPPRPGHATDATTGHVGGLVALPGGSSYHRPDCRVVQGKDTEPVDEPDQRDLTACKLCEPRAA